MFSIKEEKKNILAGSLIAVAFLIGLILFIFHNKKSDVTVVSQTNQAQEQIRTIDFSKAKKPFPVLSMQNMKTKGCIADGILFGYEGRKSDAIKMINRSECKYLHRSIETWLRPPDFKEAEKNKKKITNPDMIYGMFIAEAIDKKANYFFPAENRDFEFSEMCRRGSDNFWGEHTCKPAFQREEYRKYLRYITERAMDMGVQSFLFGQIFYQESSDLSNPVMPQIIRDMREYADFIGIDIVIGAQTNDIADENYLRLFDYIEGGVGINAEGKIESGPCFSRWWQKEGDWCWALLWDDKFSKKANNVFLHLDWSGKIGDDMSIFTRMEKNERAETLSYLHKYFTSKNEGFMMPMLAVLHKYNGGCYGDKARYYSADNRYSCQDETAINKILRGK